MSAHNNTTRLTIRDFQKLKDDGVPIAMLTAYDATSARLGEAAGIPALLVGDSLGMVIQGHDNPVPVRLDHIIYHAQIVTRVTQRPLVVGDMPFMTYSVSAEKALENAARLMQEGAVGAVKMEGGEPLAPTIRKIVEAGIPVMGHIGLLPQSVHRLGGLKRLQGKDVDGARQLLRDAEWVQDAGAFALVIEGVPAELGQMITQRVHIPTIGIAAGPACDGQIQVFHDLLGLFADFTPRHTHRYAEGAQVLQGGIAQYVADVLARRFPTEANSVHMKQEVLMALQTDEDD
jgi:3-methyl-2-oxobutanoate hydroxymethyltransferase